MDKNEKKSKDINSKGKKILQIASLGLGLIFMSAGAIIMAINFSTLETFDLRPSCFTIFIGGLFLFFGLGFVHNSLMIFFGVMIFTLGIPMLLRSLEILPITNFQMIPYAMICAGLGLFVAGLYRMRKIRSSYIFPSLGLVLIGLFFLLFSSGLLKLSLTSFLSRWYPLILLAGGGTLVVIFYIQQIKKKDFPYIDSEKDESLDDEE